MTIKLISTELSPCCGREAQIVRSRDGGLISRDCLKCGKSHYVNESQLPKLPCGSCGTPMQIKNWTGQITSTSARPVSNAKRFPTLFHRGVRSSAILD